MGDYIQVITAVPRRGSAERIADSLVRKGLAGCAQVAGPVRSTFRWKGRVERAREWLCIIKTERSLYKRVEREIRTLHRYEVPEILSFRIDDGYREYMKWLEDSLG